MDELRYFITMKELTDRINWKLVALFFAGIMTNEVLTHLWLILDNMLPVYSRFFNFTLTKEINIYYLTIDLLILIFLLIFALSKTKEMHNRQWYE